VEAQWIDLVDPTAEEILQAVPMPLDPDAVEVLASPAADPRVVRPFLESHGGYVLAVLAFPHVHALEDRIDYLELDVLATPSAVVTVRKSSARGEVVPVDSLAARSEERATSGRLFHAAVDTATDAVLGLVDSLYERIDELENDVEHLSGADTRRRIAELRHELLLARRTASGTRGVARRIVDGRIDVGRSELFPPDVETLFVDTFDTLVRVTEEVDVARELLAGVRDYYQAKVMEQQNDVAKKLTMIASLVLVPSFIVGFYGQNFAGEFGHGYWSVGVSIALILATTAAQLAVFRWRRWV
jgi:magnesium transporter